MASVLSLSLTTKSRCTALALLLAGLTSVVSWPAHGDPNGGPKPRRPTPAQRQRSIQPPPRLPTHGEEIATLVVALPDEVTHAATELKIESAEDVIAYFRLHRQRVAKIMKTTVREHGREILRFYLHKEPTPRQLKQLEDVTLKLAGLHDKAKMDPLVAEGLRRVFGVEVRDLPDSVPWKKTALSFFKAFNKTDSYYSAQAFDSDLPEEIKTAAYFIEMIGDLVDRRMNKHAAIEFGKTVFERISECSSEDLFRYMKDLATFNGLAEEEGRRVIMPATDFFRKIAKLLEPEYPTVGRAHDFGNPAKRRSVTPPRSFSAADLSCSSEVAGYLELKIPKAPNFPR